MALNAFRNLLGKKTSKAESFLWHSIDLVDEVDSSSRKTALHYAAAVKETGQVSPVPSYGVAAYQTVIKGLLLRGANPHATDCFGETPLMQACKSLHFSVMKQLIDVSDVTVRNGKGQNALQLLDDTYKAMKTGLKIKLTQLEAALKDKYINVPDRSGYMDKVRSRTLAARDSIVLGANHDLQQYRVLRTELLIKQDQQNRLKNPNCEIGIIDPLLGKIRDLRLLRDYYAENFPVEGSYGLDHMKAWLVQKANRYAQQVAVVNMQPKSLPSAAAAGASEKKQDPQPLVFPAEATFLASIESGGKTALSWQMFRKANNDFFQSEQAQQGLKASRAHFTSLFYQL